MPSSVSCKFLSVYEDAAGKFTSTFYLCNLIKLLLHLRHFYIIINKNNAECIYL